MTYLQALDAAVRRDLQGRTVGEVIDSQNVAHYADMERSDVFTKTWSLRDRFGVFLLHVLGSVGPRTLRHHASRDEELS